MAVNLDRPGPYAPTSAILEILGRNRSKGVPNPVTNDVLGRAGIPDSLQSRTMQALQCLDLIDEEGKHTPTLDGLRLAPEADYPTRMAEWLNTAYADVITFVDASEEDETRIRDAFRSYKPVGQQDRMVSLFMGLYAAAGIRSEKAPKPRASRPNAPKANPRAVARRAPKPSNNPPQTIGSSGIPGPLAGLLSSLPPNGRGWTQEQRDRFMTAFPVMVDYCFPIVAAEATEDEAQ